MDARAEESPAAEDVSIDYLHVAEAGSIDRTLTLTNNTSDVLAAELTIEGLDEQGDSVEAVTMSTAYGSHRGEMLLSPGENIDVVMALGPVAPLVRDVRVGVEDLAVVDIPVAPSYLDAVPLGPGGRPTSTPSRATKVRVTNPSEHDLTASVVHLLYDVPSAGEAQSIQAVSYVDRAVALPARGSILVPVDRELRTLLRGELGRFPSSIKAYRVRDAETP